MPSGRDYVICIMTGDYVITVSQLYKIDEIRQCNVLIIPQ